MGKTTGDDLVFKRLEPVDIDELTSEQIKNLFMELNASITQRKAQEVVSKEETIFWVGLYGDQIVGMALMATYHVVSGHKGMIEDVVVNQKYRGKGIGKKLIQSLVLEARRLQLNEILLFSGHHRKAAISLYTSHGFTLKDSGLYRLPLH